MVGTYMYVYSFLYFFTFFIIKYWSYLLLIQNHTCNEITLCSEPLSHGPHSFTTKSWNNDIHSRKHNAGIRIRSEMEETSEIPTKSLIFQARKLLEWLLSYIRLVNANPNRNTLILAPEMVFSKYHIWKMIPILFFLFRSPILWHNFTTQTYAIWCSAFRWIVSFHPNTGKLAFIN